LEHWGILIEDRESPQHPTATRLHLKAQGRESAPWEGKDVNGVPQRGSIFAAAHAVRKMEIKPHRGILLFCLSLSKSAALSDFHWQNGYGAFSVSPAHVEGLRAYIANQEERHRHESFQDEFRRLLRKYGVEWDERYVWD
jgi:hypothetical protein